MNDLDREIFSLYLKKEYGINASAWHESEMRRMVLKILLELVAHFDLSSLIVCVACRYLDEIHVDEDERGGETGLKRPIVETIACFMLAAKLIEKEETVPSIPGILKHLKQKFVNELRNHDSQLLEVNRLNIYEMEVNVCKRLKFRLGHITVGHFCDAFMLEVEDHIKSSFGKEFGLNRLYFEVKKFVFLGLNEPAFLAIKPSLVACACIHGALEVCEISVGLESLQTLTAYDEALIRPLSERLTMFRWEEVNEALTRGKVRLTESHPGGTTSSVPAQNVPRMNRSNSWDPQMTSWPSVESTPVTSCWLLCPQAVKKNPLQRSISAHSDCVVPQDAFAPVLISVTLPLPIHADRLRLPPSGHHSRPLL